MSKYIRINVKCMLVLLANDDCLDENVCLNNRGKSHYTS